MKKYQSKIEQKAKRLADEIDEILACARLELIVPYCDKFRMEFSAGMGSWSFRGETKHPVYEAAFFYPGETRGLPKRVIAVLEMDYPLNPGQSCGSMMASYRPKGFKR